MILGTSIENSGVKDNGKKTPKWRLQILRDFMKELIAQEEKNEEDRNGV